MDVADVLAEAVNVATVSVPVNKAIVDVVVISTLVLSLGRKRIGSRLASRTVVSGRAQLGRRIEQTELVLWGWGWGCLCPNQLGWSKCNAQGYT